MSSPSSAGFSPKALSNASPSPAPSPLPAAHDNDDDDDDQQAQSPAHDEEEAAPLDDGDDLFGDDDDNDDDENAAGDRREASIPIDPALMAMDGVEEEAAADVSSDEDRGPAPRERTPGSDEEEESDDEDEMTASQREEKRRLEYAEDDDEAEQQEVREKMTAGFKVDKREMFMGSDGKRYNVRLPKQLRHVAEPYDPETYVEPPEPILEGEEDGEIKIREEELQRRKTELLLYQVEHTMRWRWVDGPDGKKIQQSNTRVIRWSDGSLSLQLGPPSNLFDIRNQAVHDSYLVAHHAEAEILQAEAPINNQFTLVPANLKGDMHRKLAQTVKGANEKRSRIELLEDDSLVANVGMGGGTGAQKGKKPRAKRADGGVAAARKRSAGGGIGRSRARRASYESDDESDEEEYARARPSKASKKSNEDSSTRYKEDGFVVDDSDDSADGDSEDDSRSKKSKKFGSGSKKRRPSPTMSSDEEPEAVESEESEEEKEMESEDLESEEAAPRAGEPIKKRTIVLEDEDEDE